jgi:hypothetical protein
MQNSDFKNVKEERSWRIFDWRRVGRGKGDLKFEDLKFETGKDGSQVADMPLLTELEECFGGTRFLPICRPSGAVHWPDEPRKWAI